MSSVFLATFILLCCALNSGNITKSDVNGWRTPWSSFRAINPSKAPRNYTLPSASTIWDVNLFPRDDDSIAFNNVLCNGNSSVFNNAP